MFQEKREEEDSPELKTSLTQRCNEDYIEKHERERITAIRNDTGNTIDERMTPAR